MPAAARQTVGIAAEMQEKWVGGLYYVRNVVMAFKTLSERIRPAIVIIGDDKALDYLRSETGYPGLRRVSRAQIGRAPPPRFDLRRRLRLPRPQEIDVVLLGSTPGLEDRAVQWVPDFQEERFPEFFKPGEVDRRRSRNGEWFSRHRHVMVSSRDVAADLSRHYGSHGNVVHVVPFAAFPDANRTEDDRALRDRFGLPERYFICCNQVMRHKNHAVILRALAMLGPGETMPPVVMTGAEHDYRDPAFAPSVKALAVELGVADRTKFLGFLPRGEQLGLLAGAIALVQPSLCEGWSSSIEDAKALGRHVLASEIAVHREQLDRNVDFFGAADADRLVELLRRCRDADPSVQPLDYEAAQQRFATALQRVVVEVNREFSDRGVDRLMITQNPTGARN